MLTSPWLIDISKLTCNSFVELQEAAELAAQGRRQAVVLALQVSSCAGETQLQASTSTRASLVLPVLPVCLPN